MATCPSGHQSASDDFCDVCGFRIDSGVFTQTGAAPVMPGGAQGAPARESTGQSGPPGGLSPPGQACPSCGTPRVGQFCESCGYSFATSSPQPGQPQPGHPVWAPSPSPAPSPASAQPSWHAPPPSPYPAPSAGVTWTAVVTADRDYFETVKAASGPDAMGINFPSYCPERRFRLSGPEVRVGRRSASRGIDPEIDLTGPPADPGVSRLHALLISAPDGTWSVVDPGSANGTLLNGDEIPQGRAVPLHDGDRIHLGAWTALTIVASASPPGQDRING